MSGLDVLDEERGLELQEHRGGQNICTLVCIHWLGTPRHEGKWNALCWSWTIQRLSHFTLITITTLGSVSGTTTTRKLRWRWSLRPPDQRVLLTRPQASGGGSVLLTGTSQVKKSSLSVMDTHHILITDKENVHQPIRTIILRQCLLLLTLFYP